MKKIFLSLLALVGMAGGLLCTSCSGGGGKDKDGPARAMAGVTLNLWGTTTPALEMRFQHAIEANISSVIYTAGTDPSEAGQFTITDTGKEDGGWVIRGIVNINSSRILNYPDFKQAIGVSSDQDINTIDRFIIYFYFTPTNTARYASVYIDGTYGEGEGAANQFSKTYPREVTFNITGGHLDTSYLEKDAFDYNTVDPAERK